jgi:hypothetical protein
MSSLRAALAICITLLQALFLAACDGGGGKGGWIRKSSFALLLPLILCSCATGYGAKGFSGGYSDTRIDDTHYVVSFDGNGFTDKARVWNYWIYRCAELTQQHGYEYFSTQRMNATPPHALYDDRLQAPGYAEAERAGFVKTHGGGGPIFVPVPGGGSSSISYHSRAIVSFYHFPQEANASFVLNAQSILSDLGAYVKGGQSSALVPQTELIRHALVFTPNSSVAADSHLDVTLPEGWEKQPLSLYMIESGGILFATNSALGASMTLTALKREKVGDALAFTQTGRSAFLARLSGSHASQVQTLDISGRRAYKFDITGIVDTGDKMTFVFTVIEGNTEIALLTRSMRTTSYADNKDAVVELGSAVVGFSSVPSVTVAGPAPATSGPSSKVPGDAAAGSLGPASTESGTAQGTALRSPPAAGAGMSTIRDQQ